MRESTQLDFTGQNLYVGIDVHKKSWTVSIHTQDFEFKTFTQPPDPAVLSHYLKSHFPNATYYAVYEAGYCGFWIHDQLWSSGVQCSVVHPGDVPTTDKERRRKRDPRDARKLARGLRNGDLEPLYVPPVEAREDRALVRMRGTIIKEQKRIKNRIKGLLHFHGIALPADFGPRCWSEAFLQWLETVPMKGSTGHDTLASLLRQLQYYGNEQAAVDRKLRALARSERYRKPMEYLLSLPGVGFLSALIWLTELVDIKRFTKFNQLTSYVGLVPYEHSTSDKEQTGPLDHRGNKFLRTLLIENSWVAIRKDLRLMMAYNTYCKRMTGNKAIIRIARKLLRRIWYVWGQKTRYEMPVA